MLSARMGDATFGFYAHGSECCPHCGPGINARGDTTVLVEMRPVVRMGDGTFHTCPHCRTGMAMGLVPTVLSSMRPHHSVGHPICEYCGVGIQMTGSLTVIDSFM